MKCVKIVDSGRVYSSYVYIHETYGDINKYYPSYSPQEGTCGKVIWEGRHPSNGRELYIVALRNKRNIVIAKGGTQEMCNKECTYRKDGSCEVCQDN